MRLVRPPQPVEVRVDDTWHHGQLEAWRRDVDGWRAFVRYSTGVGMRRLEWLESDKLKAGVEGLTRAAANVLGRHGIRVNAVRSGFIDTDMLRYAWNVPPEVPFPIGSSYESNVPLGRVGQPAVSAAPRCPFLRALRVAPPLQPIRPHQWRHPVNTTPQSPRAVLAALGHCP